MNYLGHRSVKHPTLCLKTLRLPIAVLAAAATLTLTGAPRMADAQDYKWVAASGAPETDFIGRQLNFFVERVKELSGGRIVITAHHGGSLGADRDILESILQGSMQLAAPGQALMAGWYKPAEIWTFPYLFKDVEHKDRIWDTVKQEYAEDMAKQAGFRPLASIPRAPRQLSANKVVKTPEDMKGLKIRVPETPMWRETFKRFGASPTPLPFPEVYQSLKSGVIDGQDNPAPLTWNAGFFEVNSHLNLTEHMMQDSVIVIGEQFYQQLPQDLKDVLHQAAADAEKTFRERLTEEHEAIMQKIKEKGVVVTAVDKEAFRARVAGMESDFPHVKKWVERFSQID